MVVLPFLKTFNKTFSVSTFSFLCPKDSEKTFFKKVDEKRQYYSTEEMINKVKSNKRTNFGARENRLFVLTS